jgi:hypothetical protein
VPFASSGKRSKSISAIGVASIDSMWTTTEHSQTTRTTLASSMPSLGGSDMIEVDSTPADIEERESLAHWPPSIQRLLDNVAERGQRMRRTTGGSGFLELSISRSPPGSEGPSPSASPKSSFAVVGAATLRSNVRWSGDASASRGVARLITPDRVATEGWRANLLSPSHQDKKLLPHLVRCDADSSEEFERHRV